MTFPYSTDISSVTTSTQHRTLGDRGRGVVIGRTVAEEVPPLISQRGVTDKSTRAEPVDAVIFCGETNPALVMRFKEKYKNVIWSDLFGNMLVLLKEPASRKNG